MKTISKIVMLLAGVCGANLAPHTTTAQFNSVNLVVAPTPAMDSVSYDCATGDVQVHVNNMTMDVLYSVVSVVAPEGTSVTIPDANTTGAFNLSGATEAVFRASHDDCFVDYTVQFDCGGNPLPLDFLAFDARLYKKNMGFLEWKVSGEQDVNYYEVEKSADGVGFKVIAKVDTDQEDAGTATRNHIDSDLYIGNNYYRIKQILLDGRSVYSEIRTLPYYTESQPVVTIYPNPAVDHITFDCTTEESQVVTLWIMDNLSRVVMVQTKYEMKAGKNKIVLPLQGDADGAYFIGYKLQSEHRARFLKFIKNKS